MWKSEHRYQPRGSAPLRLRTWTLYVLIYRRRLRSSAISGSILGRRAPHLSASLQPGAQVPRSVHKMLFLYPGLGLNMTLVLFVISIIPITTKSPMYNGFLHSRSCSTSMKLTYEKKKLGALLSQFRWVWGVYYIPLALFELLLNIVHQCAWMCSLVRPSSLPCVA